MSHQELTHHLTFLPGSFSVVAVAHQCISSVPGTKRKHIIAIMLVLTALNIIPVTKITSVLIVLRISSLRR
ncbi:hypothetical protein LR007_04630 [candidate division NPL-UPA2 bacterium]|nr:hypothetical protein [candidate division NPL-UPA2 bacterium]